MSLALRAQLPLYCLDSSDDTVPIAAQERMERLAGRLWNDFYDNHRANFFKDRHWLGREWPQLALEGGGEETEEPGGGSGVGVVEVGCGVGNAALPLLDVVTPPAPVYACDFSAIAIDILKKSPAALNSRGRLRAFVADASRPGALTNNTEFPIKRHSLAAATLIFALSAMSPAAMVVAVDNVKNALSQTGGRAFVRDYAVGDMASARLAGRSTPRRLHAWLPGSSKTTTTMTTNKESKPSNGESDDGDSGDLDFDASSAARAEAAAALLSGGEFFARGDGTRAFYFSESGLRRLFEAAGFQTESIGTVHMTKENRATREKMPRKWVQAVFRLGRGRGEDNKGITATAAAAAGASTRLTRTTATTMTSEKTEKSRAEEAGAASLSLTKSRASRYSPEWQESDDEEDEDEDEQEREREASGGDNSSSSSSDEETTRAAARLFRTVLVDSTSKSTASSGNGNSASNSASSSAAAVVSFETHVVDVGPPLGPIAFSAAPSELRSTLSHTGLLSWPAAPALARILLDSELAASFVSSSSSLSLLELGAGGSPLVALAAARSSSGFRRVVSTDGSQRALRLLSSNIAANARLIVAERVRVRLLPWGDEAAATRALAAGSFSRSTRGECFPRRFDVVVGADTLYSAPALPRLMTTIAATLGESFSSYAPSLAVLCYQERRVRVADAEAAAARAGLVVVDPAPAPWLRAAERAGVGEGKLLRLLCLRPKLVARRA